MKLPQGTVRLSRRLPVLAVLLLLACTGGDDDNAFEGSRPATATSTSRPAPAATRLPSGSASPGLTPARPSDTPAASPAPDTPATGLPQIGIERVFPDLAFDRMTGMYQDGEGSWYVTEQPGRIQRIDAATGEATLWLDLTDRVDAGGSEMGLLGFALAPDFDTTREFYVDYTGGGQSVVARFTAAADRATVDRGTERRLLTVDQPFANHNGGQIAFGPDGYLYVSLGDGGGGNDPSGNGQNLDTLLASILRIDVSGGGAAYAVPPDNPFVAQSGARGEIWAHGFRNPWRFSFDSATGDLWVGDVGQSAREEVDLVVRGGNYGWNVMEGFGCRGGGSGCETAGLLPPVFDYATGSGGTCSVTGGFVYRGDAIPALRGAYVFSDYCSGVIYALRATGGVLTEQAQIAATGLRVSSFARDNAGELYVLDLAGGGIYKLVP